MSGLLIDTNAYMSLLNGTPEALTVFNNATHIFFPFIVVAELLSGFKHGTREEKNRNQLSELFESEQISILFPDDQTLEFYSTVFASLRKKGTPIPTNDIWIAALALQYELPLFTYDKHFKSVELLTTASIS